ncbi:MAG: ATP-dependent DNA helicase RecQ [Saprospiraceae bacterium]|jgi:ATP-dependent DNA helicase RecQ|nr:ATP-dependent DNA helicase RecQ [Saprospiraceae bacterium]
MDVKEDHLTSALQEYFGFSKFKGQQKKIIESLLAGNDTFVLMPTGGGKSLCYQLPALLMEGTAIVISPLIALMKNQVDSIRGYSSQDNIAHFLNSSLNKGQIKQVKQDIDDGKTKLLYIAPETLTKEENLEYFHNSNISFVAVDEAHCISEWGHDFRPEYRRIRTMIDAIGHHIPVIALTATATPKVRSDIVKILDMDHENTFMSSFNRDNLFYEIRPKVSKEQTIKSMLQFIKSQKKISGIIYVQNRKTTEDLAEVLNVNGIKAAPYHAGLDAKSRARTQDDFLMENVQVICATIAFGMGIDKPDVRFVIHYDIPKSIENYYQETGRAGRDGLDGNCIAYFSIKDLTRLEKFLRDKPVAEREMGSLLLQEVEAYAESSACRRQFLLHYFGEEFDDKNCHKMCDNCRNPKELKDVTEEMTLALEVAVELNEGYHIKTLVDFLIGKETQQLKLYKFTDFDSFGSGKDFDENFWNSIFRQALLRNLVYKDIENYGLIKLSEQGIAFMKNPENIKIPLNQIFPEDTTPDEDDKGGTAALDENLVRLLQDVRKVEAKKHKVPPFVIFTDPSIEDMATQYPVSMEDMSGITGVSRGKAERYGQPFIKVIAQYVEDNEIERPMDFLVKQVAYKSKAKVNIIQSIDKKIPLEDIARANNMDRDEFYQELYGIVTSGTKLDLNYYTEDLIDEYVKEDIFDYFMNSETDNLEEASKKLKELDITWEEIELMRIVFLSEMAN